MDRERKERRAATRMAVDTIKELLEIGVVPRSVTVGDIRIDVGSYAQPQSHDRQEGFDTPFQATKHRGHLDRLAERVKAHRVTLVPEEV